MSKESNRPARPASQSTSNLLAPTAASARRATVSPRSASIAGTTKVSAAAPSNAAQENLPKAPTVPAEPPPALPSTPLRFETSVTPDFNVYQYGITSAPPRPQEGYRTSGSLESSSAPDGTRVGKPPLPVSPSPAMPPRQTPSESETVDVAPSSSETATGDDSGDTVRPNAHAPNSSSSALEELERRYCVETHAVDVDEPDRLDAQGRKVKPSIVATVAEEANLVRHLAPAREFFKKVASSYVFSVGLIGQFESVLERLAELFEFAYVRLGLPESQQPFAADFHLDLLDLVNQQFSYGAILRAHNHVVSWIDYAAAWIEHLLGLRDAGDSFPPRPAETIDAAVSLRGYYNDFAEVTYRANQSAASAAPETPAKATATAGWKAKDTIAMSKYHSPMPSAFDRTRNRRATYAVNPVDFTAPADSWLDGLGSPRFNRSKIPTRGDPGFRASERVGARAAFAAERPPHFDKTMPAMLKGDTGGNTTAAPSRHPSRAASRDASRRGSAHPSPVLFSSAPLLEGGGPPDDDDDDDDDDPDDRRDGRRDGQGRGGHRDTSYHPTVDPQGGAPGGGDPYGGYGAAEAQFGQPNSGQVLRVPTFDMRFKTDVVPAWDGSDTTAMEYFGKLAGLCRLGGEIPALLPRVAPQHFTGRAEVWWRNLSHARRVIFQGDFFAFVHGIREFLLSDRWTDRLREAYTMMRFRQRGFADEMPFDFIARRAYLCRFLFVLGPLELVDQVMANAPRAWHYILGDHNVADLDELMRRASALQEELLSAYQASYGLSESKIEEAVKKVLKGGNIPRPSSGNPFRNQRPFGFAQSPPAHGAAVHLVDTDRDGMPESDFAMTRDDYALAAANLARDSPESYVAPSAYDSVCHSVYAFLSNQSKQRPPPAKYHFPKSHHTSPRAPPSPCKVCGGEKHWDRECPHWPAYETRRKQGALVVDTERPKDEDAMYESVFSVYLNSMISHLSSSSHERVDDEDPKQELEPTNAAQQLEASADALSADVVVAVPRAPVSRRPSVSLEEVEDDEERTSAEKPKALTGAILELVSGEEDWRFDLEPVVFTQALTAGLRGAPGPPPTDDVVRVPVQRKFKPGRSAKGVSILSCRGRIGGKNNKGVTLRLDSGASISLISKEYLLKVPHPPRIRRGLKVRIAQLTNDDPTIEGYVVVPIYIRTVDDVWLEFETELYVVPQMTVEVLLGEDWHTNFGLDVLRSLEGGTRVNVASVRQSFVATSRVKDTEAAERADAFVGRSYRLVDVHAASFVKAKSHRRARAARHRRKLALTDGALRAYRDVLLPPETTCMVEVAGELAPGKQWMVDRNLVACGGDCYLTVPNALLSTESRLLPDAEGNASFARVTRLPVANPTKLPRMLRAGTLLAHAKEASASLDKPSSEEELERMTSQASILSVFAQQMGTNESDEQGAAASAHVAKGGDDDPGTAPAPDHAAKAPDKGKSELSATDELEPPAAAEAPDPTVFESKDLEDIIDISPDAPKEIRERALELFKRRIKAFGFDGRLGQLAVDAQIRTKEGTEPISEPLRGASPEKKRVIEEQLSKWFEMGVIEDSISPWAAPVVIVYRNGKARFCVDYRKLNAATIPDSFPIPRQSDILSALSGSQVLSSLDALAGFNQMGIATEDIEKTAFRTHKGLFQFLRMPFGLRNGPAIFQRVMQGILSPFLWLFTLVYIDDIVVYSASYDDHLV